MKRPISVGLFALALVGNTAQADPITLVYSVSVTSFCPVGADCVAYDATFPLTVTFDSVPTSGGLTPADPPAVGNVFATNYFGVPTFSGSPLPFLPNPYSGVEGDVSYSQALAGANPSTWEGYREGRLLLQRYALGSQAEQWQIGPDPIW